ncbi:MAG: NO-inducible flavohemoprotein, partial [Maioricimonas sp. JB049]
GGIGVTPLLAMARSLRHAGKSTPVYFLQAARNSTVHAFAEEVRELSAGTEDVHTCVIYDQPLADDVAAGRCQATGYVTTGMLHEWAPCDQADFYVCGPPPFMAGVLTSLRELGVEDDRVRHEFFGPKQALVTA